MPKGKRKQKGRQGRAKTKSASKGMPRQLYDGLEKADRLDRQRKWAEARDLLEELERRYPGRPEVLTGLVNVYYELGDITSYQFACQRLVSLRPDDPDLSLMLAGSCLANVRPAMALHNFARFLRRWPDDVRADDVRKTVADLEAKMDRILQDSGFSGEDGLQLAALHEEVLCCLQQGEFGQARRLAERLLKQKPDFVPAINNLGEAHFREGRTEEAIAAARRVLHPSPDNYHALANLARYLCMSGRADEAQPWAERLKSVESADPDLWVKKAETFTYLGDEQAVLDAFEGAQQAPSMRADPGQAILHHLAAVASMRLGREKDARRLWNRSLKLNPGLEVAKANLDDLKKPPGQQHAPWAYDLNHWLPNHLTHELVSRMDRLQRRGSERALARETRRLLQDHPQLAAILPILLDRGDPVGRQFALRTAMRAETPETFEVLRDFALGQRGPDEFRHEAARAVREAGLLPAGPVRMWIKGQWAEVLVLGFEIHQETNRVHQPYVEDLAREAMIALKNDDPQEAEHLLDEALQTEPDAPDLLNNLATAYRLQGRSDKWKQLIHEIHQRHPDYFFGRANMAFIHLQEGDIEAAREMLTPLLSRQRFHLTEFNVLCQARIELCVADRLMDDARSWLNMWEEIYPDNPDLKRWQRRLAYAGLKNSLSGLVRR